MFHDIVKQIDENVFMLIVSLLKSGKSFKYQHLIRKYIYPIILYQYTKIMMLTNSTW